MSQIVSTELGRFRKVVDSQKQASFLFECPACKEWLPMSEGHLSGANTVLHFHRDNKERLCEYFEAKPYGATLVSAMQSRILMEEKPYDTHHASLELGE